MTKRRRLRATSVAAASPPRPGKYQRLVVPANRGSTVDNPIVLDDSADELQVAGPMGHATLQYGNFFELDQDEFFGFQQPPELTPGSTSSDVEEIITSPTKLFYHDTGRPSPRTPAFRCLPILTERDANGKAKQNSDLQLSSGWPTTKANRVVNVYLEGEPFGTQLFDRHSHLHLPNLASPDLSVIHLCDIRRELARILQIDDLLSLQLEIQHASAMVQQRIFHNGLCTRYNAAWNDHSMTDRDPLSKALSSTDSWIRVRVTEYITVQIPTKDLTIAITPASSATVRHVRDMVASVAEVSVAAVSLFADYAEIEDGFGLLSFLGQQSRATIQANVITRECANCLDDVGEKDFPFEPTTEECMHDLEICKSCIGTWIATSLDNGNWKNITCLSVDCGSILQYADVKRYGTETDMERYERFSARDALSQMPDFRWCLNPECEHGQIHDDGGGREQILTCEICQFKRCTACDRAWHQDETCEQYARRLAAQPGEVDASEAWVATNSRKCPGCQSPIQKNEGCDHMTCTRCRRQFCWICQADYSDIHRQGLSAHKPHCQYHSGNVIDPHAPPLPYPPVPLPAHRRGHGRPRARRAQAAAPAPHAPPAPPPAPAPAGMFDFVAHLPGMGAFRRAPQAAVQPVLQPAALPQFPPAPIVGAPAPGMPPNAPRVRADGAQRRQQLALAQLEQLRQQRQRQEPAQQNEALLRQRNAPDLEGLRAQARDFEVRLRGLGNANARLPQLNEAQQPIIDDIGRHLADLHQRVAQRQAAPVPQVQVPPPPVVDANQIRPTGYDANPALPRYDPHWGPLPHEPWFEGLYDPFGDRFILPGAPLDLLGDPPQYPNPNHDPLLQGFDNEFDPEMW